jgi:hypothetical protein
VVQATGFAEVIGSESDFSMTSGRSFLGLGGGGAALAGQKIAAIVLCRAVLEAALINATDLSGLDQATNQSSALLYRGDAFARSTHWADRWLAF